MLCSRRIASTRYDTALLLHRRFLLLPPLLFMPKDKAVFLIALFYISPCSTFHLRLSAAGKCFVVGPQGASIGRRPTNDIPLYLKVPVSAN
jgi:hypothetical protein